MRFTRMFLNLRAMEIWVGNVITSAVEWYTFWFIGVFKFKKSKAAGWEVGAPASRGPHYAASPLGCAIAKLPEYGEGTPHSLGAFTPFFIHLHQQWSTWWHRDLSLTLHRFFCFWQPPSTPRELCDLCCAFPTPWEHENSWGVRARLFSCTEKKSLMTWTPQRAQEQLRSPNHVLLQLPWLVAFFSISSLEICAKPVEIWTTFRILQCRSFSSDLPGMKLLVFPAYVWSEMSPLP